MKEPDRFTLTDEAKALVVLAFRNGPIEDVHAGKTCPTQALQQQINDIVSSINTAASIVSDITKALAEAANLFLGI